MCIALLTKIMIIDSNDYILTRWNTDWREIEIEQYKNMLVYPLIENILFKIKIIFVSEEHLHKQIAGITDVNISEKQKNYLGKQPHIKSPWLWGKPVLKQVFCQGLWLHQGKLLFLKDCIWGKHVHRCSKWRTTGLTVHGGLSPVGQTTHWTRGWVWVRRNRQKHVMNWL